MSTFRIEVSEVLKGRPEAFYATLSDYRIGHPAILPKPAFKGLTVEKGGQGAGTEILVETQGFGRSNFMRMTVSEPEPGRVLREVDEENGIVTDFIVDPVNGGEQARVTIRTDFTEKPGILGFLEKWLNRPMIRYLYRKELRQLEAYVQSH
jgi:hypothetical protein